MLAECVANDTGRPLISLTRSDLGEDREESSLLQWFRLAAKWGAILLIDEADIFLDKSCKGNHPRTYLATGIYQSSDYCGYAYMHYSTAAKPGVLYWNPLPGSLQRNSRWCKALTTSRLRLPAAQDRFMIPSFLESACQSAILHCPRNHEKRSGADSASNMRSQTR